MIPKAFSSFNALAGGWGRKGLNNNKKVRWHPRVPEARNPGEGRQAVLTDLLAMPTMGARLWKAQSWAGGQPHKLSGGGGAELDLQQGQCGWAEGQDMRVGWVGARKASLILEIKPHMPSAPLTRPGQSAWQGGIGVFLKGEGIEMKQDAHNSSAFQLTRPAALSDSLLTLILLKIPKCYF